MLPGLPGLSSNEPLLQQTKLKIKGVTYYEKRVLAVFVLLIALLAFTGCEPEAGSEPDTWAALTSLDQLVGTWKYTSLPNCSFDNGVTHHTIPTTEVLTITKTGNQYSVTDITTMTFSEQAVLDQATEYWESTGAINYVTISGLTATFNKSDSYSSLDDAADFQINQYGNKLKDTHLVNWIYIKQ